MKKLRIKMIRTVFLSVMTVFLILTIITNASISYYFTTEADNLIFMLTINNYEPINYEEIKKNENGLYNRFADTITIYDSDTFKKMRYFIVTLDTDKNGISFNGNHISDSTITQKTAYSMASSVATKSKKTGYKNNYRYRLEEITDEFGNTGYVVVFLNCTDDLAFQHIATLFLLLLCIIFTVLITLVFSIFSDRFMRPFEENSKRQKQFITDASHELKTPLSIISANAQVLEYKHGSNDWTKTIITQTDRMGNLINNLLLLAKMDELNNNSILEEVDFTQIVTNTIEPFQEVLEKKNASLSLNLQKPVTFVANKEQMKQLVSILIENATKYVEDDGEVIVTLSRSKRFATLKIYNTADLSEDFDGQRLFDRFYRPDHSRTSSTGGHGIGLSIAKKITNQMNGNIDVKKEANGITFQASLSCQMKLTASK